MRKESLRTSVFDGETCVDSGPQSDRVASASRLSIERMESTVLEVSMKKVLMLIVIAALLVSMPMIVAGHGDGKDQKGERVFCCHGKAKCDNLHGKADCEKEGGKVVKSCKECK
jgi:hypothetical protein